MIFRGGNGNYFGAGRVSELGTNDRINKACPYAVLNEFLCLLPSIETMWAFGPITWWPIHMNTNEYYNRLGLEYP